MSCRQIYFGYGGNMNRQLMREEAPDSELIGLAFIEGWKWIISQRGYANLVCSPGDVVYGIVYTISPSDEANLDLHEGVPDEYSKLYLNITMGSQEGSGIKQKSLFYIDINVTQPGYAQPAYAKRINEGIEDARDAGMPEWYIEKYLRKFIPAAAIE